MEGGDTVRQQVVKGRRGEKKKVKVKRVKDSKRAGKGLGEGTGRERMEARED